MDGINPTLAFAALFLGLSGHPRDVAQQPAPADLSTAWAQVSPADAQVSYLFDCPGVSIAMEGEDAPAAPRAAGLFQDQRMALAGSLLSAGPTGDDTPASPGWLSGEIFHDTGNCGELVPQP